MSGNMIAGLIGFLIGNVIASLLGTAFFRSKYPKYNKYLIFTLFFVGYCGLFYFLIAK